MSEIPRNNDPTAHDTKSGEPSLAKELPADLEGPLLFPPAEPRQQIMACYQLVYNEVISEFLEEHTPKTLQANEGLQKMMNFLDEVKNSQLSLEPDIADKIVNLSVAAFDLLWLDNMAQFGDKLKYRYYRGWGAADSWTGMTVGKSRPIAQENWLYMTKSELSWQLQNLPPQRLISKTLVPADKMMKIRGAVATAIQREPEGRAELYVPFLIDDEIGGLYALSYKSALWNTLPRSELPIQDVLTAYLRRGVSYVEELNPRQVDANPITEMSREEFEQGLQEVWQAVRVAIPEDERATLSAYKKRDYLKRNPAEIDQIAEPAIRHYQKEFGQDRGLGEVAITFTRSGVSANGVAFDLAKQWVGSQQVLVNEGLGWYFENSLENTVDHAARLVAEAKYAQILLINVEPNAPLGEDAVTFSDKRDQLIQDFVNQAVKNPRRKKILIVDKTCAIDFKTEELVPKWPPNLKLIETMSLTKHQRGGRGYFYGLVLSHGLNFSQEKVTQALATNRGRMTLNGWINIPKMSSAEILKQEAQINEKIGKVTTTCLPAAEAAGLTIEPYSYYFFVYQPLNNPSMKEVPTDEVPELDEAAFKAKAQQILDQMLASGEYPTIEEGDSFNLNKTRVAVFLGMQVNGARQPHYNVIRVSPGRTTPLAELEKFTAEYIHRQQTYVPE